MKHGFSRWTATRLATIVAGLLEACGGAGQEAPLVDSRAPAAAPASSAAPVDELAPAAAPSFTSLQLGLDEIVVLDPRATRRGPRASSLLVVEIRQLEALLRATDPVARDRPMLLRRLAEDDVELAEAATNEAQYALDRYDAATAKARRSMIMPARRAAIANYRELLDDPSNAKYPLLDETRWFLAWEYARVGDAANARRVASSLVGDHPASPHAARASFLLGSLSMADAAADVSVYGAAEQAFAMAARTSDPLIASIALDRLERSARAAGDTTAADAATRELARLATGPTVEWSPSTSGCAKDVDCKGDRICERGLCVAPQ